MGNFFHIWSLGVELVPALTKILNQGPIEKEERPRRHRSPGKPLSLQSEIQPAGLPSSAARFLLKKVWAKRKDEESSKVDLEAQKTRRAKMIQNSDTFVIGSAFFFSKITLIKTTFLRKQKEPLPESQTKWSGWPFMLSYLYGIRHVLDKNLSWWLQPRSSHTPQKWILICSLTVPKMQCRL